MLSIASQWATAPATVTPSSPPQEPAGPTFSGVLLLAVLALLVWAGWRISLRLHPHTICKTCGGEPRSYGKIYTRSFALCPGCDGRGRQLRWGAKDPTA